MNIIIPCSGKGKRFLNAGISTPKLLLPICNDKLVLDYLVKMFPTENNIIFITNEDNYCDIKKIIDVRHDFCSIIKGSYDGKGPVSCILSYSEQLEQIIDKDDGVIICYCDFYQEYDYIQFKKFVKGLDGCVASYTGYHPHFYWSNNTYASSVLDKDNNIIKIKEKFCKGNMEDNFHSSGMYYFRNFEIIKKYFKKIIDKKIEVNGEYYVSLVYNEMIADDLTVKSYNDITYFLQLGTPEDYLEYIKMYNNWEKLQQKSNDYIDITNVMLISGRSSRFIQNGYLIPKQFLNINNQKMYLLQREFMNLKRYKYIIADDYVDFVDMTDEYNIIEKNNIGQAYSYYTGCKNIKGSVLVTSCDILTNYITSFFLKIKDNYDALVFVTTNHREAIKNPEKFSWVKPMDHSCEVQYVSLKKPLSTSAANDLMVIGSFYFNDNNKIMGLLKDYLNTELHNVNEYYLDDFINYLILSKYKVAYSLVDGYFSFGTPEEFKEAKYWIEYFNI
jgi:UTP-glucose-1-phosphate uridylyltransferase